MRILFISSDIEIESRGIGVILKNLVRSAKSDGHTVGVLTGMPIKEGDYDNKIVAKKAMHVYMQHYFNEGLKSFEATGYPFRKKSVLKSYLLGLHRKLTYADIDHSLLSDKKSLIKEFDFLVNSPFIYQYMGRNFVSISKRSISRAVKNNDIDLVISASPTIIRSKDLGSAKLATFVHDIIPIDLFEAPINKDSTRIFGKQITNTLTHSDALWVNSKDTRDKILEIDSSIEEKIEVLYGVGSSRPSEIGESNILSSLNLCKDQFILNISSTVEPRKNVDGLIRAYAHKFNQINQPLVIVGSRKGYRSKDTLNLLDSLPDKIKNHIHFTGYISEDDKYTLLSNAGSMVLPSHYEGLGLMLIEAFEFNIPTLASRKGGIPEAGGDAVSYLENSYDIDELSTKIVELVHNTKLRENLRKNIKKQSGLFTYEKFQERTIKAISKVIGG